MATIPGTAGNDSLLGTAQADTINGEAGADTIIGGAGSDLLNGGANAGNGAGDLLQYDGTAGVNINLNTGLVNDGLGGTDTVSGFEWVRGGAGSDTIVGYASLPAGVPYLILSGREGNDKVTGGRSGEDIFGGTGNDTLAGGGGADHIRGDAGIDQVLGQLGADTLEGGAGRDRLVGGGGNDVFLIRTNSDREIVADFTDGQDRIDLSNTTIDDFAELQTKVTQNAGNFVVNLGAGDSVLVLKVTFSTLTEADFIF